VKKAPENLRCFLNSISHRGGTSAAKAAGCAAGSGGSERPGYVHIGDQCHWHCTSSAAAMPAHSNGAKALPPLPVGGTWEKIPGRIGLTGSRSLSKAADAPLSGGAAD